MARLLWCGVAVYDMLHQRIDELNSQYGVHTGWITPGSWGRLRNKIHIGYSYGVVGQKTLRYGVPDPFR